MAQNLHDKSHIATEIVGHEKQATVSNTVIHGLERGQTSVGARHDKLGKKLLEELNDEERCTCRALTAGVAESMALDGADKQTRRIFAALYSDQQKSPMYLASKADTVLLHKLFFHLEVITTFRC